MTEPEFNRFLVTGGAGFIGSHLVDRLLDLGRRVYVLDDFSTGTRRNISHHPEDNRLYVIKGSVTNPRLVKDVVRKVQCVYHLAGQVSVPKSIRDPLTTNRINAEGSLNLLRACLQRKKIRFVYASSCAVYGETGDIAASEDMAVKPLSPYASSKLSAEAYAAAFARSYGLQTVSLRLFNVYGTRQSSSMYGGVVSSFLQRLRHGEPLVIYGDGYQTRDFIHVSDVVQANIQAANLESAGDVINVGTGKSTSILELADLIIRESAKTNISPVHTSRRHGEILHSRADVTKQETLLGFKPKISLRDGIRSLLAG